MAEFMSSILLDGWGNLRLIEGGPLPGIVSGWQKSDSYPTLKCHSTVYWFAYMSLEELLKTIGRSSTCLKSFCLLPAALASHFPGFWCFSKDRTHVLILCPSRIPWQSRECGASRAPGGEWRVTEHHSMKGLGDETKENVVVCVISERARFNSVSSAAVKILFMTFLFLPHFPL